MLLFTEALLHIDVSDALRCQRIAGPPIGPSNLTRLLMSESNLNWDIASGVEVLKSCKQMMFFTLKSVIQKIQLIV